MAKKEPEAAQNVPVKVRAQTEEEVRRRLKSQGKIKDAPKKKDEGVREQTEEEVQVRIEDRTEREEQEAGKEDENVRPLTNKDIALRKSAAKDREAGDGGKKEEGTNRVQTEQDIKDRNDPDTDGETEPAPEPEPEPEPEPTKPTEIFAKDIVSFKNDDGEVITGKVKRVTSKNEAIVDTEDAEYTVPCDLLTKVEKEEK